MSTATLEYVETRTSTTPEESSHIVLVPDKKKFGTPQAYILAAMVEGFPVEALCGYTWIPHKNPTPLPVCETCLNIYQNDPNGFGDRGELPDA